MNVRVGLYDRKHGQLVALNELVNLQPSLVSFKEFPLVPR